LSREEELLSREEESLSREEELLSHEEEDLLNDEGEETMTDLTQKTAEKVSVSVGTDGAGEMVSAGTSTDPIERQRLSSSASSSKTSSTCAWGSVSYLPRASYNVHAARAAANTVRPLLWKRSAL
jgi:hypothetical protein